MANKLKNLTTTAKTLLIGSCVLTLDSIVSPYMTGKTIHEHLGLPPESDYKLTALGAEQALLGLITFYGFFCGGWFEEKRPETSYK